MTVAEIERKPRKAEPQATAPHVYQAVRACIEALAKDGISKSRKNQQQNYAFRGIDDVYNALADVLAEQSLIVIPSIKQREITERTSTKGGALFDVVVQAEYRFVSAVDGSEFVAGPFWGEAMDSGDKATNKAMSAAYKYMAMQTFCIPTEGDNDADATTHQVAPGAAGGERSPTHPPPRQQQPTVRPAAKAFVDKSCDELRAAEADGAMREALEMVQSKPGWKQLTATERAVILQVAGIE